MARVNTNSIRLNSARLEYLSGTDRGKAILLSGDRLSIGRTEDNDIVLPSETVSRTHAFLTFNDGGWLIQDNRSKNRIIVNGSLVDERWLSSGDLVQIGEFAFRFNSPDEMPATVTAAIPAHPPVRADVVPRQIELVPNVGRLEDNRIWLYAAILVLATAAIYYSKNAPSFHSVQHTEEREDSKTESRALARVPVETEQSVLPAKIVPSVKPEKKPTLPSLAKKETPEKSSPMLGTEPGRFIDEKQEVAAYVREGISLLRKGEFKMAAEAFRFALVIEPHNPLAVKGIKAAEYQIREIGQVTGDLKLPKEKKRGLSSKRLEDMEKRREVSDLIRKALDSLNGNRYSEAIRRAEQARKIPISGETSYLNEAKQIIDKAKMALKEEFEPFLIQAREKFSEGEYAASQDLCEEMLKRDPDYKDAQECAEKAKEMAAKAK